MGIRWICGCWMLVGLVASPAHAAKGNADSLCENLLATGKGCPLNQAFAGFWLGRDATGANARLAEAWQAAMDDNPALTPDVANAQFKWQMRTWVRLYYLFGPGGTRVAGRLSPENAARIQDLFWNYACAKSTLARADLKNVWFIQGSENHDMMDLGNAFLAAHALADLPGYADRPLPDGGALGDHVRAWTAYFTRYCEERIRHGLLIEFGSPTYGKYYVPELVNVYDFAPDATLRARVEDYLNLIWADWAMEQLDGVRGGAKARCYQGNYSRNGESDSWYAMGQVLLGAGGWADAARYNHPILGYGPILATSGYQLPEVIADLATSPVARGEYVYQSRRPGRMAHIDPQPSHGGQSCWYHFDGQDSRFVRYTWCTPDHILGSYTLDPALAPDFQIYPGEPDRAKGRYAAITTQNLWQGLIFNTGPDARIFPQCAGTPDKHHPDVSTTYVQQVAVQHENVLLVQANRAHPAIRAFRIHFGPGMKERLVARDGWLLLEEGDSYAAVRLFDRGDAGKPAPAAWQDDHFLQAEDLHAPAVLVTGRKVEFADLGAFAGYLAEHTYAIHEGRLEYGFQDRSGTVVTLGLCVDEARLPEKNGAPVDLSPAACYQSPFLNQADGEIRVRFEGDELRINSRATE